MFRVILIILLTASLNSHGQFIDFKGQNRWTYETKQQTLKYKNGIISSEGTYGIYTVEKKIIAFPIGRHLHYRRNGKLREVEHFTSNGLHQCDTVFRRNGKVKTIIVFEKLEENNLKQIPNYVN